MKLFTTSFIILIVLSLSFAACTFVEDVFGGNVENKRKPFKTRGLCGEGLLFIEGGSFTKGLINNDVLNEWNQIPSQQEVRSFCMDETEVTNAMYLEYTNWLKEVFPSSNSHYKLIHESALPDTLAWKSPLGYFDELTQFYFRHPAYAEYPVVGVNWLQAVQYAEWRTDRANEATLINEDQQNFNTSVFLKVPDALFKPENMAPLFDNIDIDNTIDLPTRLESGLQQPKFRLPTEVEWEYAALAIDSKKRQSGIMRRLNSSSIFGQYGSSNKGLLANFKSSQGSFEATSGSSTITTNVKSYPPNDFGLYNMLGNVSEWVLDIYRPTVDNQDKGLNYHRNDTTLKEVIGPDGKNTLYPNEYFRIDTLPSGRPIVQSTPEAIQYSEITDNEIVMRPHIDDLGPIRDHDNRYHIPRYIQVTLNPSGEINSQNNTSNFSPRLISDQSRIYKGGSWKDRSYWLDPAKRRFLPQYLSTNDIGFRCARTFLDYNNRRKSIIRR